MPSPTPVEGDLRFVEIRASYERMCARTATGDVHCWGATDGAGGMPRLIPGLGDAVQLAGTYAATCALRKAGGVRCWGVN